MTLLALVSVAAVLQAPPREEKPAPSPAGFFRNSAVDFWGDKAAAAKRKAAEPKSLQESIWAEPIKLPDGRTSIYLPPKPVLQFLEAPTRETAKEYVAWQEERMKRLKAAMELLRDLRDERHPAPPPPAETPSAPQEARSAKAVASPPPSGDILYFKKAGCPWCAKEDGVLSSLARSNAGLRIRTIPLEESPELARDHGVTVVPTLVVHGKVGRTLTLRGFMTETQILSAIQEVNRDPK
jgi:hypothetical protein